MRPWTLEEWWRSHRAVGKSQNHRSVRVGKDLWRSSSPMPLQWQGHPEEVTQECIQVGFECLQRGRRHNFPWDVQCCATFGVKKLKLWGKCKKWAQRKTETNIENALADCHLQARTEGIRVMKSEFSSPWHWMPCSPLNKLSMDISQVMQSLVLGTCWATVWQCKFVVLLWKYLSVYFRWIK